MPVIRAQPVQPSHFYCSPGFVSLVDWQHEYYLLAYFDYSIRLHSYHFSDPALLDADFEIHYHDYLMKATLSCAKLTVCVTSAKINRILTGGASQLNATKCTRQCGTTSGRCYQQRHYAIGFSWIAIRFRYDLSCIYSGSLNSNLLNK